MESVFKYAIFHYNRLVKEAHNLSFKIRIKEETLNLIASESAVQTVHDGRRTQTDRIALVSFAPSRKGNA